MTKLNRLAGGVAVGRHMTTPNASAVCTVGRPMIALTGSVVCGVGGVG